MSYVNHVTDTRIAACALGLQFPGELHSTVHTNSGEAQYEVRFSQPSTRFPHLDLRRCILHWQANRMLQPLVMGADDILPPEPLHVFACAMRAQQAYDAFLHAQRNHMIPRLVECPGSDLWVYEYVLNQEANESAFCESFTEKDLALCAALAPMGIPMMSIAGGDRQRVYTLARHGFPIRTVDGQTISCDALHLIRRAPTAEDPYRLALEDEQPMHPVSIGYGVLSARAELAKAIRFSKANLLVTDPGGGAAQALISIDFKGHVGEAVCRHLKSPSSALNI